MPTASTARSGFPWTPGDTAFLKTKAGKPNWTAHKIAQKLKREVGGVRQKAGAMGISLKIKIGTGTTTRRKLTHKRQTRG